MIETFEVPVTTLDTELKGRSRPVNFVKCDVEGHEMAVLGGASNFLETDRPIIVLEADMPTAEGMVSARAHEMAEYLRRWRYIACNFDYDGQLRLGKLNAFPVHHTNVAFLPEERSDLVGLMD